MTYTQVNFKCMRDGESKKRKREKEGGGMGNFGAEWMSLSLGNIQQLFDLGHVT